MILDHQAEVGAEAIVAGEDQAEDQHEQHRKRDRPEQRHADRARIRAD